MLLKYFWFIFSTSYFETSVIEYWKHFNDYRKTYFYQRKMSLQKQFCSKFRGVKSKGNIPIKRQRKSWPANKFNDIRLNKSVVRLIKNLISKIKPSFWKLFLRKGPQNFLSSSQVIKLSNIKEKIHKNSIIVLSHRGNIRLRM